MAGVAFWGIVGMSLPTAMFQTHNRLVIGLNQGFLILSGLGVHVMISVIREVIAWEARKSALWQELTIGATMTQKGIIVATSSGPVGHVVGRVKPLKVLPFKHILQQDIKAGYYFIS